MKSDLYKIYNLYETIFSDLDYKPIFIKKKINSYLRWIFSDCFKIPHKKCFGEKFGQSWQNDSHYVVLTRNSFVSNSFLIFLHSTLQPLLCKSRPVNFETNLIYGEQKGRSAFTINLAPSSDSFVPRFRTENNRPPTLSYVRTNRAKSLDVDSMAN